MKRFLRATFIAAAVMFALTFVLSEFSVLAQTTITAISGRVMDSQGAGVAGAGLALYERDNRVRLAAVTDATGTYRFERLAPGDYILEAQAQGFAQFTRAVRVGRGEALTLDVPLEVSAVNAEIVVTASGTAQSVDEVSKAVTVINMEEIEQRDEITIAESLRRTPGLRVQQLSGPGSLATIKTRGLRNEDTAILIDGLRFRDSAAIQGDASSFLSDLLFVNTDRLEVLRGSGSSLYGTNAIGGVVNIITDNGGGKTRGQLQAEGGSLGLFRGRAQVAGGAFDDRLRYSGGIAHLNVTRGVDGNDAARNTSGQGFVQYDFTPSISLTGRVFAGDSFAQLNDSPFAAPGFALPSSGTPVRAVPLARSEQRRIEARSLALDATNFTRGDATFIPALDDPDSSQAARFFSGALIFAQRLSETASYRISYQRTATNRTFRDGPAGTFFEPQFNNSTDIDGRIDTLNARTDFQLGRHNLFSGGYEFERESYADFSADENPEPLQRTNSSTRIRQRSHTFFAQDQLRLLEDRLQLSAAFRVQRFALSPPEFQGGAPGYVGISFDAPPTAITGDGSISYFFRATNTKLRGHVGNGYRAPSLYERFGSSFFGGSFSVFGDPRLRPDRSIAFDAGIDQGFAGGRVRTGATYFYTRLQEVITFDFSGAIDAQTDPFGRFIGYLNAGGGLARGVELSVTAQPFRSTGLTAAYTYTNSDQRRPQVAGYLRTLGISDHLFTLVANQRVGRRIDVTFDLFAASDYAVSFGNRPFIFDGPVKADLGASYTLPLRDERRSLRFYGKVDNLFNREYFENGFRAPGASFVGGTTLRF
ncbi:MAG: TonB-dependent receptor domain-containing protein [Pyrinomonadaceae bacterium]